MFVLVEFHLNTVRMIVAFAYLSQNSRKRIVRKGAIQVFQMRRAIKRAQSIDKFDIGFQVNQFAKNVGIDIVDPVVGYRRTNIVQQILNQRPRNLCNKYGRSHTLILDFGRVISSLLVNK